MPEQDPEGARAQLRRGRLRLHAGGRAARGRALPAVRRRALRARLPGRHRHPGFIQKIAEKNFRGAYDVITDTNLLPAVCGRVCPQENQCEGVCTVGDTLEPVAIGRLERFVGDMAIARGLGQRALHRAERLQGRHRRLGPGRHGLRRRHGQGRLRGHRLRGLPRARRRAQVRHPRLPPAQRGDRRRDRQAAAARRQVRVQHAGRPPVHHRADDRRDGLPRGVHRHRRRLPELHGHPGRIAQRRAVGQRAADALQPDARRATSPTSTRRCSRASASP